MRGVSEMLNHAVEQGNDPLVNDSEMPFDAERLRGGPAWMYSDYYTVEAQTDDPAANGPTDGFKSAAWRRLSGPMLQALLEDRFQLRTHRIVEQVPMYDLTVSAGGLKLKPMEPGGCDPSPRYEKNEKPPCGWTGWGVHGPNRTIEAGGVPLSRLAEALGDIFMDHHVLDKTGVSTIFNLKLEYAPDEHTPFKLPRVMPLDLSSNIPRGETMFTAIEHQLGLTLVPATGPHGVIVIDGVDRPRMN